MRLGSGIFEGLYDFRARLGDGKGTNPEELLGAAHAGCFSRALALQLTNAGFAVKRVHTTAKVDFDERDGGRSIHRIDLDTEALVSVKNLPGVDINLRAKLLCGYAQAALQNRLCLLRAMRPSTSLSEEVWLWYFTVL
jgi:lipoyl-dependent peroxiredoxin